MSTIRIDRFNLVSILLIVIVSFANASSLNAATPKAAPDVNQIEHLIEKLNNRYGHLHFPELLSLEKLDFSKHRALRNKLIAALQGYIKAPYIGGASFAVEALFKLGIREESLLERISQRIVHLPGNSRLDDSDLRAFALWQGGKSVLAKYLISTFQGSRVLKYRVVLFTTFLGMADFDLPLRSALIDQWKANHIAEALVILLDEVRRELKKPRKENAQLPYERMLASLTKAEQTICRWNAPDGSTGAAHIVAGDTPQDRSTALISTYERVLMESSSEAEMLAAYSKLEQLEALDGSLLAQVIQRFAKDNIKIQQLDDKMGKRLRALIRNALSHASLSDLSTCERALHQAGLEPSPLR